MHHPNATERNAMHIRSVPAPVRRKVKSQAAAMGLTLAEWLGLASRCVEAVELCRDMQHVATKDIQDILTTALSAAKGE